MHYTFNATLNRIDITTDADLFPGGRNVPHHNQKNVVMSIDKKKTKTEQCTIPVVSGSTDLKEGDKIDIGGFITTLEEIKYDPYAKIVLYWFWNERGEYKYNVRDFITKV